MHQNSRVSNRELSSICRNYFRYYIRNSASLSSIGISSFSALQWQYYILFPSYRNFTFPHSVCSVNVISSTSFLSKFCISSFSLQWQDSIFYFLLIKSFYFHIFVIAVVVCYIFCLLNFCVFSLSALLGQYYMDWPIMCEFALIMLVNVALYSLKCGRGLLTSSNWQSHHHKKKICNTEVLYYVIFYKDPHGNDLLKAVYTIYRDQNLSH